MKTNKIVSLLLTGMFMTFWSCGSDDNSGGSNPADSFDRSAMLINWADNIIVPAYEAFQNEMSALKTATDDFVSSPTAAGLTTLKTEWKDAYLAWQNVSIFEIGTAEDIRFQQFMNTYPTDASNIEAFIASGTYDLTSLTLADEQGFPALDYLLNGLADNDADILAFYTSNANASNYNTFLSDVVNQMNDRTSQVVTAWTSGFRDTFVNNTSSSVTGSISLMVNDFLVYYESRIRNGKVGIPAGIVNLSPTGNTLPDRVEGFYAEDLSKDLLQASINTTQNFFSGRHFNSSSTGESLASYLDALGTTRNGENLSTAINNQFNAARTQANGLSDSFIEQINTDNSLLLQTFDALQNNVVLLKTDMVSALNITLDDFGDQDGD